MKYSIKITIAVLLLLSSIPMLGGCFSLLSRYDSNMPISSIIGSPLVTGKWEDDTFINEWTGFTVTLPLGFWVSDYKERIQGEYASDFLLYHDDYPGTSISLSYFDVTQGARREHTAGDYLNSSKKGLLTSQDREFTFKEDLGSATIGKWEYTVMSGSFVNIHDDTQIVYNIDRYAYRFVGTMVVFVAMYPDESREIVNAFLDSIEQE